jgi:hypothetical protein
VSSNQAPFPGGREAIKEEWVVQKLLRVIPKHLSQVVVVIEVTQDLSKMTLENVSGRLRTTGDHATEDDVMPPPHADGKISLTEELWKEKLCHCSDTRQGLSSGSHSGEQQAQEVVVA